MVHKLLIQIFVDLLNNFNIIKACKTSNGDDLYSLHWGVGIYIRNKYLWNNESNMLLLSIKYKTNNADDVSLCILNDLFKIK